MISSSGFVMYKTKCSCTGENQTTVFVRPETCEDVYYNHHKHDDANNEVSCCSQDCHECSSHTKDCGCDSPEHFFFKLKDKAVDDEVKFVSTPALEISIVSSELFADLLIETDDENDDYLYVDPPLGISSSLDFLVQIQQLKIPVLA